MLVLAQESGEADCRVAIVSACETASDASQSAPIEALATFQMKMRDSLDFRVDFAPWLAANGHAVLTAANFAVASGSPASPIIVGQAFVPAGKCVIVLSKHVGAKAGDAYWLDVTVTVGATTPSLPSDVAIPARTLVRRIHIVLVNG